MVQIRSMMSLMLKGMLSIKDMVEAEPTMILEKYVAKMCLQK